MKVRCAPFINLAGRDIVPSLDGEIEESGPFSLAGPMPLSGSGLAILRALDCRRQVVRAEEDVD